MNAAWKLFYEQGYEDTTVKEIIELSSTSKGSFYHYFDGKNALLSTLSLLFDENMSSSPPTLIPEMTAMDKLLYLNSQLYGVDYHCGLRRHRCRVSGDGSPFPGDIKRL